MKFKLIICFIFTTTGLLNSQSGIQLKLNNIEYFDFHLNSNGSPMLEVYQDNTFFGWDAGNATQRTSSSGRNNSFFGNNAGEDNTDGEYNTFIGSGAGLNSTIGDFNQYVGYLTGGSNISGGYNALFGSYAGYYNSSGSYNVCMGYQANYRNQTGNNNTIIGYQAGFGGFSLFSATGNVFLGYQAGYLEQGSDKLYISNSSTASPLIYGDFDNQELKINGDLSIDVPTSSFETRSEIKFGYHGTDYYTVDYDFAEDQFEIREGNTKIITILDFNVGIKRTPITNDLEVAGTASKSSAGDWLANSDARLKKNINPLNSSVVLSQLLKLQGVTYEWNDPREGQGRPDGIQYGFTAQNIQEVYPELVSEDNEGYLQTAYGTYDAMYIEAIRALTQKIEILENRLAALEQGVKAED